MLKLVGKGKVQLRRRVFLRSGLLLFLRRAPRHCIVQVLAWVRQGSKLELKRCPGSNAALSRDGIPSSTHSTCWGHLQP